MDPRELESGASGTPPVAPITPSVGFPSKGNAATQVLASVPGEYWFYQMAEELRTLITSAGLTPSSTDLDQILTALPLISGINVFSSVAQMKASTTIKLGQIAVTNGYYSENDGGGCLYTIVASATGTDDAGSFIDMATDQAKAIFFADQVNAKQFGAHGNNTDDDVTFIQAAVNYTLKVILPAGQYITSAAINLREGSQFIGQGTKNTTIVPNFATGNIIQMGDGVTNIKNIKISDLTIDAPTAVPRTSGAAIELNNAQQCSVQRVELLDQFRGIQIEGPNTTQVVFEDVAIRNVVPVTGTGVFINGGGDHFFSHLSINNPSGSQPLAGIEIHNSNATWVHDSDILHSGSGLLVNPGLNEIVTWLFFDNVGFDLCETDGIRITSSDATAINKGHQFTGCWTSSNDSVGFRVSGVDDPDGIYVLGHRSFNNGSNGYLLQSGVNVTLDACRAAGNSVTIPGTSAGIEIEANVNKFAVRNCSSGLQARYTNLQGRGINIETGTSDDYIVMGNDFTNNALTSNDGGSGSNKIFSNNLE